MKIVNVLRREGLYLLKVFNAVVPPATQRIPTHRGRPQINGLPLQTGYTGTHAVTAMQLQIPPCTVQVAGHTSSKSHPAELRACSTTILAALLLHLPHFKGTNWPNLLVEGAKMKFFLINPFLISSKLERLFPGVLIYLISFKFSFK